MRKQGEAFKIWLESHVEKAVMAESVRREMPPEDICAELVELGLVSLSYFHPASKAESFTNLQRELDSLNGG